jgi:competence protein ComEC
MKPIPSTLLYMALIPLTLGALCVVMQAPTKDIASISMLDIGQGDSFLIQSKEGTRMLIDGGPDETVLSELADALPPGDRRIDVVIATHPDLDHIGGLPLVLMRYSVGLFLTTQATSDSEAFKTLMHTLDERNIPAYYARYGMKIVLDPDTSFSILFPDRDTTWWETNTASVVGRLNIGDKSALFTGDSPSSIESFLVAVMPNDIDVDVVKLGHHGSKTSSSEQFLKATSPTLALISAGVNNRYGHPAKEVVERLSALHIPYVSTQDTGRYTIEINDEGE